jgi:hypothetical protein
VTKVWLVAAVLALALMGCQLSKKAAADPVEYGLNEPFALSGGQEATITAQDLRLRFTNVLEDSRCPTQVECFWTGQARIAVVVSPRDREPTTVEFNTNPAPGENRQTVEVGDYTVKLESLDPYPQTPDDSPALEDYRATLSVEQS